MAQMSKYSWAKALAPGHMGMDYFFNWLPKHQIAKNQVC